MRNGCSDRLTRSGRDLSFPEAMECYKGEIAEELGTLDCPDPADGVFLERAATDMRDAWQIATAIYDLGDEEWAAGAMQTHPNGLVQLIGEALEVGDYSILAI